MEPADLVEIEAIKQLKARYFRLLDTKQWESFAELFTEDFEGEYHGDHPVMRYSGRQAMVEGTSAILGETLTVHQGMMPEIEVTGPDTARGIWAMMDIVALGKGFTGFGHYHEEYRKVDGRWMIARSQLTRLHVAEGLP